MSNSDLSILFFKFFIEFDFWKKLKKFVKNGCQVEKSMLYYHSYCGSAGIGRQARLRILWVYARVGSSPISRMMQKWRNWQTRTVQVRVVAIPWGFKSLLLHWQRNLFPEGNRFFRILDRVDLYTKTSPEDPLGAEKGPAGGGWIYAYLYWQKK